MLPWALLLSLEDVRQLAGGLFFFRRRKKNQERRHPFERVDDDQRNLSSGLQPKKPGRPSLQARMPGPTLRAGDTCHTASGNVGGEEKPIDLMNFFGQAVSFPLRENRFTRPAR